MRAILLWSFPILAFVMTVASDAVLKAKKLDAQSSRALIDRDKRTGAELLAIPLAFIAVTSTIAAVFSVANFVYSVVQGHKQMKELKEIKNKLDEIEGLINRRFAEISKELEEIKLITVYADSVSITHTVILVHVTLLSITYLRYLSKQVRVVVYELRTELPYWK